MYYFLIEDFDKKIIIKKVANGTDKTHSELKEQGYIIKGCFCRLDYAELWQSYYNGEITQQELKEKLN